MVHCRLSFASRRAVAGVFPAASACVRRLVVFSVLRLPIRRAALQARVQSFPAAKALALAVLHVIRRNGPLAAFGADKRAVALARVTECQTGGTLNWD